MRKVHRREIDRVAMTARCFQHVPFEGPGYIATWLKDRGIPLETTRLFAGDAFPGPDSFDLLIVMGGPMSVNDQDEFPWLAGEKAFVRQAIDMGKKVLGICLGAQVIASATGAGVFRNAEKEVGWFRVSGDSGIEEGSLGLPGNLTVFHWHGETFELPPGAVRLAESPACRNQAFRIGDSVVGLQFHLETTPESVREMVEHGRDELVEGEWIQSGEEILSLAPGFCRESNEWMERVLDALLFPGEGGPHQA